MKIFTVKSDGSLIVQEDTPQKDALGAAVTNSTIVTISPQNIAAHRRDPTFESALQAAKDVAGNLTSAQLAALPVAK
jgi:hypothetical protein